ncbi:hypothetical protein [Sedimentibacter saalensis]|uniref:hypothetical protein n=1 Tax=Sedimentibacter saalensis TaxID=130788 RepID=UPI002896A1EB|nr:hypothetical protein [Sedimentibacter saalensis]
MKKTAIILMLALTFVSLLSGCTRLPASVETGVKPSEYTGKLSAEEMKKENESLKTELDSKKLELEKLEKDYLNLAKNNEAIISRLQEAESLLDIVVSDDLPDFKSEGTDKNSIISYLNDSISSLDDSYRKIEIIQSTDSKILFLTTGYGEKFSQVFTWTIGEDKPSIIEGASFEKSGKWQWLLQDRFIVIDSGSGDKKIIDAENSRVAGEFKAKGEIYLLPDTSTVLIQNPESNVFSLYDFGLSSDQELKLDSKNKYTSFRVDDKDIIFEGTYKDQGIEYNVSATINIEEMKEAYSIKSIDETGANENMDTIESEDSLDGQSDNSEGKTV